MPLGAPILWPEMVSQGAGPARRAAPAPCRTPAPRRCGTLTPAAAQRPAISATGCTTPTSLLTHMTDTTAGRSASACVERVELEPPVRVHREHDLAAAQVADGVRRGQDRLVLDGGHDGAHRRRPGRERPAPRRRSPRLSASVPPEVKITWFGSAPTASRHLAAGLLEARARGPAEPVGAGRVAEGLRGQVGQHGLQHLGADRGGGGVVEIDGRAGHGSENTRTTYMLCTPRAITSSTAMVSWVKNGSP